MGDITSRAPRTRGVDIIAGGLAVVLIASTALLSEPRSLALGSDTGWTACSLFAALVAFRAWRVARPGDEQRAWGCVFFGTASWFAGQVTWDFYDVVLGVQPAYPSLADAGYLASAVFYLLAFVSFLREQRGGPRDRGLWLDAVIVTIAATAVLWVEVLAPALRSTASLAGRLVAASWATLGVVTLWLGFVLLLQRRLAGRDRLLFVVGQTVLSAASVWYAMMQLGEGYVSGRWVDLSWSLAFLVVAAAAARVGLQPTAEAPAREGVTTPREVSVGVVIAAIVLLAWLARSDASGVASLGIVISGVALAARLVLALREDDAYAGRLRAEVEARTRDLQVSLAESLAAELRLRVVMNAVPDAIATATHEGRLRDDNGLLSSWFDGRPPLTVDALAAAFPEADRAAVQSAWRAACEGATTSWSGVLATEPPRDVACTAAPVAGTGPQEAVLFVLRDLSEQRRAERAARATERLATLGELASGVAHEINNPAAIVAAMAESLHQGTKDEALREQLAVMKSEALRIGTITRGLLQFSRREPGDAVPSEARPQCSVLEVAGTVLQLHAYRLKTAGIVTSLDISPSLRAAISTNELQQVLLNLVVNAEQALHEHRAGQGTIQVTARAVDATEPVRRLVEVTVVDDGPGVAEKMRARLFQAFETSKATGTGIGLSLSRSILRRAGGELELAPTTAGACFRVRLPRADAAESPVVPEATPTGPRALRILVVDDEPLLLRLMARQFKQSGHTVQTAEDGRAALTLFEGGAFDVVVTDSRMPGMDGPALIAALRGKAERGSIGIVLTTGDTAGERLRDLLDDAAVELVGKPFTHADLERAVQASIGRARAGPA